jgi:mRNA degradation ribonuclease J1/J2
VQAKIVQIELSGHADQAELVQLIQYLKPKRTVLVHGHLKEAEALSKQVCELTEVSIPEKNETISI